MILHTHSYADSTSEACKWSLKQTHPEENCFKD